MSGAPNDRRGRGLAAPRPGAGPDRGACERAGRSPDEVTLTVVTKFFPASDVRLLLDLGVRHVGENRHQEAHAKAEECADLDLIWHFVGGLQTNKAAAVATYASVVRVRRPGQAAGGAVERRAHERDRTLDVLVQVSLDDDPLGHGPGRRRPARVPPSSPSGSRTRRGCACAD